MPTRNKIRSDQTMTILSKCKLWPTKSLSNPCVRCWTTVLQQETVSDQSCWGDGTKMFRERPLSTPNKTIPSVVHLYGTYNGQIRNRSKTKEKKPFKEGYKVKELKFYNFKRFSANMFENINKRSQC